LIALPQGQRLERLLAGGATGCCRPVAALRLGDLDALKQSFNHIEIDVQTHRLAMIAGQTVHSALLAHCQKTGTQHSAYKI
jgi:hypothetical protein